MIRTLSALAIAVAAACLPAAALAGQPEIFPVQGVVLARISDRVAIVQTDAVPGMLPEGTRRYTLSGSGALGPGTAIDGFVDRSSNPWRLFGAHPAAPFVAGLPSKTVAHTLDSGDPLPGVAFVDQRGRLVRLSDFAGKSVLLSFVFTRCPDRTICPAVSAKYLYLQRHIDPARIHLVEITLDPPYDSPAVLSAYGKQFAADPQRWSLLTGQAAQMKDVMDSFGISSLEDRPGNYVHDDRLIVAGPDGRIIQVIPTAGWNPDDALAVARNSVGLSSNPLRRMELAAIAGIVSLCGGSASTGVVILDSTVFVLGVLILGSILAWWGRRIFAGH